MKQLKYFTVFIIFFFFNTNISLGSGKTAFIDLDFVIKQTNIGKEMLNKVENLNNQNIEKLKLKQEELKAFEDQIKKKQNISSSEEISKEIELLKMKVKQYNDEKNLLVTEFKNFKKKEIELLMRKINPIIQNYMREKSIEILLDSKNVFIGDINSDLTQIIINEINKIK